MKLALFIMLFSSTLWSRPLVLLSYFDPFGKAPFNSSERVAQKIYQEFKDHPDFELKLCSLNTVFDKSFWQLEDCLKNLSGPPKLVLGLGESNCNFKIETLARNRDKTFGADNEGNARSGEAIISDGTDVIGLQYPLAEMYCSIPAMDRADIEVSNNAGSFVCNNLAYQFSYRYQDINFGFIHVPSHYCSNLELKTSFAIRRLTYMIPAAVKIKNIIRMPATKVELDILRNNRDGNECATHFYRKVKGADEKNRSPSLVTR